MRALVTGGNGFIGSHLVEKLLEKRYQVRCLIRKTSNLQWIKKLPVEFIYGDITDFDSLVAATKGVDYVFHLSGKVRARDEKEFYQVNQQGTHNLLEACLRNKLNLKRFVYVSSQAAAGPSLNAVPVKETDPPGPISIYGKSKLLGEKEVIKYSQFFPATIIRPPSVYGPRDDDILTIFKYVKTGIKPLIGKTEKKLSIIHVFDLVTGILLAAEQDKGKNETFFIANAQDCSWVELEDNIASALQTNGIFIHIPTILLDISAIISETIFRIMGQPALLNRDKALEMKQQYWLVDSTKAREKLGFKPGISIEEGLQSTCNWYREQGWL